MKKIFIYLTAFLIIIFILPAVFTRRSYEVSAKIENTTNEQIIEEDSSQNTLKYDYAKYSKIKLYHVNSDTIEELPIDEYLYGVVSAEMPANYELEALRAQAIVARTYTLYQIINGKSKHGEANMCDNSSCCQAWISKENRLEKWDQSQREENWNKIVEAVDSTSGKIITYEGAPIDAFFHANSGGVTETATNVWGGENFPYLQSVETSGEDNYSGYSTEATFSKEELIDKLKVDYPEVEIDLSQEKSIEITEYTGSGRVRTIKFGNIEVAGTKARSLLGLRSTFFFVSIDGESVTFAVTGYGHGVGMSQTGADSMAKAGSGCEDIIKHFYTGVEITYVNDL